jgi:hypothetical protein
MNPLEALRTNSNYDWGWEPRFSQFDSGLFMPVFNVLLKAVRPFNASANDFGDMK